MSKRELLNIALIFIVWKLVIFAFANTSHLLFPLRTDFLGGGLLNYLRNSLFWGFLNFDGEHYLSIARDGYLPLTYFYFPFYPISIKFFSYLLLDIKNSLAISGIFLSNFFLFIALMGIYKLGKKIYGKTSSSHFTILTCLFFPTAFFLGAFYNESLFLALTVWSFYFAFNKNWVLAFILCGLATATRLVGIALVPAILFEYYEFNKKNFITVKTLLLSILSVSGIVIYMLYLKVATGDSLSFFHNVEIFGAQRSTKIVILPQVFYRYIFKILPSVDYSYFPAVFVTILEILTAVVFLFFGVAVFLKMRKSFFIYYLVAFLLPPLSGSFSSFPRYSLALFPAFLLFGNMLSGKRSPLTYIIFALLLLSSFFAVSLFVRGYFVS